MNLHELRWIFNPRIPLSLDMHILIIILDGWMICSFQMWWASYLGWHKWYSMEYTGNMIKSLRNRSYQNKSKTQVQLSKAMRRYTQSTLSPQMTPPFLSLFMTRLKLWLQILAVRRAILSIKITCLGRQQAHHATRTLRRFLMGPSRRRSSWFNVPFDKGKSTSPSLPIRLLRVIQSLKMYLCKVKDM